MVDSWHDDVKGVQKLDDVGHVSVGKDQAQIPWLRRAGLLYHPSLYPGCRRPSSVSEVTKPLDQYAPSRKHIGQPGYVGGVADGIVEGVCEVLGNQYGEVGVVGLGVF